MSDDAEAIESALAGLDQAEDTEMVEAPIGAKMMAPIIALAATWAVREVLERVYTKTTGHKPPHASDRSESMARVLLWAATTAAAIATVNVVIDRMTADRPADA